jgi:hypothetical protein
VTTADYEEFIAIRQELLIQMLKAVEHAGAALAAPIQESFVVARSGRRRGRPLRIRHPACPNKIKRWDGRRILCVQDQTRLETDCQSTALRQMGLARFRVDETSRSSH